MQGGAVCARLRQHVSPLGPCRSCITSTEQLCSAPPHLTLLRAAEEEREEERKAKEAEKRKAKKERQKAKKAAAKAVAGVPRCGHDVGASHGCGCGAPTAGWQAGASCRKRSHR